MRFNVGSLVPVAVILASHVEAGVITEWVKRQAFCKYCPLNPGGIVKQIYTMIQNKQSTEDCRWEATFGLPASLGGPEKPNYDHRSTFTYMPLTGYNDPFLMLTLLFSVRVNYKESDNTCSVETINRVEAMGDEVYCIAGGCGVKDITETHATVVWGACVVKDTINFVPGQTMGTRECTEAQGEVKFSRFHDTEHCSGSSMITQHVGGQNPADFSPGERGGGRFWGGNILSCSGLSAGS